MTDQNELAVALGVLVAKCRMVPVANRREYAQILRQQSIVTADALPKELTSGDVFTGTEWSAQLMAQLAEILDTSADIDESHSVQ
jgi:hypothetical protein